MCVAAAERVGSLPLRTERELEALHDPAKSESCIRAINRGKLASWVTSLTVDALHSSAHPRLPEKNKDSRDIELRMLDFSEIHSNLTDPDDNQAAWNKNDLDWTQTIINTTIIMC
ncbi:hypothetical protein F2P81_007947 [Scophthalmus maximus]|uniref:Uncharacterized protein n=1 Tax=Scophthalmus maximus TaxID=52904 RepID=A0A6A4TC15_SCOMX|nr:hypothetical protein F2P81_007947 [Scophthalmus maximus]